jgi:ARMET, C-terminal
LLTRYWLHALSCDDGEGRFPTLVAVCNGDPSSTEVYSGKLKSEPITSFLNKFAGGKKCSSMVKLDAKTDLSKLKVSQLKSLLKERGVVCMECAEKSDYIARLKALLTG